jgi:hypothetical protein
VGKPACAEAPRDGLLVQAPKKLTVNFLINGIEVKIGSTVLLTAPTDNQLTVSTLEGQATVTSAGKSEVVEAGFATTATEGQPPEKPQPYDYDQVKISPTQLLPEKVVILQSGSVATQTPAPEATAQPAAETTEPPIPPSGSSVDVTLVVPGAIEWFDSGVAVHSGQTFTLSASGVVNVWSDCETDKHRRGYDAMDCSTFINGPGGGSGSADASFPAPGERIWALLGRVGSGGRQFVVGDGGTFVADSDGTLQFRINDASINELGELELDNTGSFTVVIQVQES